MGCYQSQMKNETKLPKLQFAGEIIGNEWHYHDILAKNLYFNGHSNDFIHRVKS